MDNPEIGQRVVAAGIQTNYHRAGAGEPVMLVHGSGPGVSAWANWRGTLPVLAQRFRVIAYDIPGFGFTELQPDAKYTVDYWLSHLVALLDALKLEKVALVGNSFGGMLAAHFCARYPQRALGLTMMGALVLRHPILPALDRVAWGYEPSLDNMRELLNLFPFDRSIITEDLVQSRYIASNRPDYHAAYRAMFPPPRQAVVDALTLSEAALAGIGCEALLLHGREDAMIPVDVSLRAAAIIPRAQLHLFGQCGHWVQIERAHEFNVLVTEFLEQLRPPRPVSP